MFTQFLDRYTCLAPSVEERKTTLRRSCPPGAIPRTHSHYRVVRYNLGGIECLVKNKSDCHSRIPALNPAIFPRRNGPLRSTLELCMFGQNTKGWRNQQLPRRHFSQLEYLVIPKNLDIPEDNPEEDPEKEEIVNIKRTDLLYDLGCDLRKWEIANQEALQRFVSLIKYIQHVASSFSADGKACSIVFFRGKLRILPDTAEEGILPEMPNGVRNLSCNFGGSSTSEDSSTISSLASGASSVAASLASEVSSRASSLF